MRPFFSIVIPTYNRAALVSKTIDSILKQEFGDYEVIVVDDGSTDNTRQVVSAFTDPRISYHLKQNGERGAARNYGRKLAKGKYVNFFDSDDLMYPNHLATARDFIKDTNEPEFFHLGYDFRAATGAVTKLVDNLGPSTAQKVLFDNILSCNGVFLRTDIATAFPFEEDRVLASAEDWELWIRLICRFPIHFSNVITSSVVSHDARSIRTIRTDKVIARDIFLVNSLRKDPIVMARYGSSFRRFVAERYTFIMLCLAEDGNRKSILRWAARAIGIYPLILTSSRFLASIKKIIVNG